jgi:hypothetical protein
MATLRSHDELVMHREERVTVAVTPEVAYAAIVDVRRMGEWSPENLGGEWVDGEPATVGATFRGRNHDGHLGWETISHVTAAEPGRSIAWRVALPGEEGTDWRFDFEPDPHGVVVTERFDWRWTPLPDEGFRGRVGRMPLADATAMVAGREQHLRAAIHTTLLALKRSLEGDPQR